MNVFAKENLTLKMRLGQEGIRFFEESFVLITTATQTVTQSLGRGQQSWRTHTHTHTHTQAGCVDGSVCVSKEKESRGKSCRCEAASSPWSAQGPFSSILRLHNGIGNLPASYSNFLCPISMLRCLLWNLLSSMSGLYYYYYYNKTIYTGHICSMKIPPLYTTKW